MTSTTFNLKSTTLSTKEWAVVLFNSVTNRPVIGSAMEVFNINCRKGRISPTRTDTVLRIDVIDKGISMITTESCGYIAISSIMYNSHECSTKVVFSTEKPVHGEMLSAKQFGFIRNIQLEFIPVTIDIVTPQKLSDTLYLMKTEEETYFIVVE